MRLRELSKQIDLLNIGYHNSLLEHYKQQALKNINKGVISTTNINASREFIVFNEEKN